MYVDSELKTNIPDKRQNMPEKNTGLHGPSFWLDFGDFSKH